MKNKKFLILLVLPLFIFACANEHKEEKHETNTEEVFVEHKDDHNSEIALNNGSLWKIDDNMMIFLEKMNTEVEAFAGKSYNDYQVLAMSLQENIEGLTSNCTMTGQAHDELHKWLLPYIDTVNDFAKADNAKEAAIQLKEVKTAFEKFNQYFQ